MQEKRIVEHDPTFIPLTPTAKAKSKPLGQFSLKRKKSKSQFDFEDLVSHLLNFEIEYFSLVF